MILTTHTLTGAVIGNNISQPWIIITFSVIIHFLMDTFRHGEYVEVFSKNTSIKNSGWKVVLDLAVGFLLVVIVLFFRKFSGIDIKNIVIGVLASIFPDFVTFLYWKFRWGMLEKYYYFHSWMHKFPRYAPEREWVFRNAANDIAISVVALLVLIFL